MKQGGPVILAAGGTGGHMLPAVAVARALLLRGVSVALVTDARGTRFADQYPDIPFHVVRAETLRTGFAAKLKLGADLLIGTGQALALLQRLRPRAVVGFGGYPSFPAIAAAFVLKVPVLVHEANAVLGKANRMVAGGAARIALSLPELETVPAKWRAKAIVTGMPVRAEIGEIAEYEAPVDAFRLFVMGGSQGASVFSHVVPAAIGLLPEELRARMHVVQQCRAADIAECRHAYDVLGIDARLESFITDVPAQLAACHLLIARSGASTVTEAAVAGRPALFVPYPHHKDQQQKVNAGVLVRAGGAMMLEQGDFTAPALAEKLAALMRKPADLAAMAVAARQAVARDATKRLADAILAL